MYYSDFNRPKTIIFAQPPNDSLRYSVPSRKTFTKLVNQQQNNDTSITSITPKNYRDSNVSRDIQKLNINTSTSVLNRSSQEFSLLAKGTQSTKNIRSTSRARKFTLNPLITDRESAQALITTDETDTTTPPTHYMIKVSTPVIEKQSNITPEGKNLSKFNQKRITSSDRVPSNRDSKKDFIMKKIISPTMKTQNSVRDTGNRSQFIRNKLKENEGGIKDSADTSFKSAVSNIETHFPSLGNVSEKLGSKTFLLTDRRTPGLESEGRVTPLSLLLNTSMSTVSDLKNNRKGYLIRPHEELSFGH